MFHNFYFLLFYKDNNILFDSSLRTFEDVSFNFDYLKHTNNLYFLNKKLYNFLIHTNHLSATMNMQGEPSLLFGYFKALECAENFLKVSYGGDTKREIGIASVRYTIIQFIRLCLQLNYKNRKKIYNYIYSIVNNIKFRNNLKFYSPTPGDIKLLHWLIRYKFNLLIMLVCKARFRSHRKSKRE